MTEREALKLALEALKWSKPHADAEITYNEAITAIKEALAQPEHGWTPERIAGIARLKDAQDKRLAQPSVSVEQEPVAWMYEVNNAHTCLDLFEPPDDAYDEGTLHPLYTTPPQRKPLTDEEIYDMYNEPRSDAEMIAFARVIEAAHGIKELV